MGHSKKYLKKIFCPKNAHNHFLYHIFFKTFVLQSVKQHADFNHFSKSKIHFILLVQ